MYARKSFHPSAHQSPDYDPSIRQYRYTARSARIRAYMQETDRELREAVRGTTSEVLFEANEDDDTYYDS